MPTCTSKPGMQEFRETARLMGNTFEITVVTHDLSTARKAIQAAIAEIKRIERLLTTFDENSQTCQINRYAGIHGVKVDQEVFDLVERSIKISRVTDGAFDITYGSIDKTLWNFDRSMTSLPDEVTARQRVRLIDYRNIILDREAGTVMLREKGMRLGFGGIGKGYAAEQAKAVLLSQGISSGIVNASGDLAAWGRQANGEPWAIGIVHPDKPDAPFSYLNISDMAVATSGNYEKFAIINGKRYSHTIHPRTGMPVTGIKSVTILAPNAEIADAMATPVMIMGAHAGIHLIDQLPGLACIVIDDQNKLYSSKNIHLQ